MKYNTTTDKKIKRKIFKNYITSNLGGKNYDIRCDVMWGENMAM